MASCSACGAAVEKSDEFCSECGAPVQESVREEAASPENMNPTASKARDGTGRFQVANYVFIVSIIFIVLAVIAAMISPSLLDAYVFWLLLAGFVGVIASLLIKRVPAR